MLLVRQVITEREKKKTKHKALHDNQKSIYLWQKYP